MSLNTSQERERESEEGRGEKEKGGREREKEREREREIVGPGTVTHICNPSYSGIGNWKDGGSRSV
jgi:hypothetical protein